MPYKVLFYDDSFHDEVQQIWHGGLEAPLYTPTPEDGVKATDNFRSRKFQERFHARGGQASLRPERPRTA